MKIIRINKGKAIPLPFRFVSILAMVIITIKLMDILPEPWSILVAIAVCSFVPALWFSNKIIIINEEDKTIFDGVWTMGKRLGKPVKYHKIDKIYLNKVKTSQTQYSLANQQNIIANHEFRLYLKLDNGKTFFLLSHPLEERAQEKLEEVRKKLKLSSQNQ